VANIGNTEAGFANGTKDPSSENGTNIEAFATIDVDPAGALAPIEYDGL
jgi:hypothetical protein